MNEQRKVMSGGGSAGSMEPRRRAELRALLAGSASDFGPDRAVTSGRARMIARPADGFGKGGGTSGIYPRSRGDADGR